MDYTFAGAVQNVINVVKTRNIDSCISRHGQYNSFSGVAYNFLGTVRLYIIYYFHIRFSTSSSAN